LCELYEDRMRGQAERLIPMCREVCDTTGLSFGDMDALAVTCGPGTFTGVRIGLAAAKGLALALNIPLIGLTTLEVVAQNAVVAGLEGRIAVAHDARRGEVYLQIFEAADGCALAATDPAAVPLADVALKLSAVRAVVGTGVDLIKPFLSDGPTVQFPDIAAQPNAGMIGQMAYDKWQAGEEPAVVIPLYLRAPDAVAAKPVHYPFQNP